MGLGLGWLRAVWLGLGWLRVVAQGYNYTYNKNELTSNFQMNLRMWDVT